MNDDTTRLVKDFNDDIVHRLDRDDDRRDVGRLQRKIEDDLGQVCRHGSKVKGNERREFDNPLNKPGRLTKGEPAIHGVEACLD